MNVSKDKIKSVLLHILLLLVLYILQTSIFTHLRILGVYPLILPLDVVGIGLFEDGLRCGFLGIAAGLLCDLSIADSNAMFTIVLALVGFFTGFFSEFILARGFPTYFFLSLFILALLAFLQMFSYLVFDGINFSILGKVAVYQTLYSALFILPAYYPIRRITRRTKP